MATMMALDIDPPCLGRRLAALRCLMLAHLLSCHTALALRAHYFLVDFLAVFLRFGG